MTEARGFSAQFICTSLNYHCITLPYVLLINYRALRLHTSITQPRMLFFLNFYILDTITDWLFVLLLGYITVTFSRFLRRRCIHFLLRENHWQQNWKKACMHTSSWEHDSSLSVHWKAEIIYSHMHPDVSLYLMHVPRALCLFLFFCYVTP